MTNRHRRADDGDGSDVEHERSTDRASNIRVPSWAVVPIATVMLALGGMWYRVSLLEAQKEDRSTHDSDVRRILDVVCVGKEGTRPCKGNP